MSNEKETTAPAGRGQREALAQGEHLRACEQLELEDLAADVIARRVSALESARRMRRAWIREQLRACKRPASVISLSLALLPNNHGCFFVEDLLSEEWCQTWLGRPREAVLADVDQLRLILELLPVLAAAQLSLDAWNLRSLAKAKTSNSRMHISAFRVYQLLIALTEWGYPLTEAEKTFISDVQAAQKRAEEE